MHCSNACNLLRQKCFKILVLFELSSLAKLSFSNKFWTCNDTIKETFLVLVHRYLWSIGLETSFSPPPPAPPPETISENWSFQNSSQIFLEPVDLFVYNPLLILLSIAAAWPEKKGKGFVLVGFGFPQDPLYKIEVVGWYVMKRASVVTVIGWDCMSVCSALPLNYVLTWHKPFLNSSHHFFLITLSLSIWYTVPSLFWKCFNSWKSQEFVPRVLKQFVNLSCQYSNHLNTGLTWDSDGQT